MMADYLQGATKVLVEDPYIRASHQVQNFVRFCEMIVANSAINQIHLRTGYDDIYQREEADTKLQDLKQSLIELDIVLTIEYDGDIHDREIRLDNGWVIKIGRGLDFYQKPEGWYSLGAYDLSQRKCLETKVDIFRVAQKNGSGDFEDVKPQAPQIKL